MVTQTFLFVITGWHIAGIAVALVILLGFIVKFSIQNRFNSLNVELEAMIVSRTSKISAITTTIGQSVQTIGAGKNYAVQIAETITKARMAGPHELFRVLTEAQIPIDETLFTRLLPTIQGLWRDLEEFEMSIQSKLATRNKMLVTVPDQWFVVGEKLEIQPIVTSEASEMVKSGILTPDKLFN